MSLEKKFHKLIEEQDKRSKEKGWGRIKAQIDDSNGEVDSVILQGDIATKIKSKKSIVFVALAFLLFVIFLSVTLIIFTLMKPQSKNRYCTVEEYIIYVSDLTMKEYSEQSNNEILFFDWYLDTDFHESIITELIETKEIICLEETMTDMETGYNVTLKVTDTSTYIDFLDAYEELFTNEQNVSEIRVEWGGSTFNAYARFEYKNYRYYLEIPNALEPSIILEYVEQLLLK